jgi:hypothetical protein
LVFARPAADNFWTDIVQRIRIVFDRIAPLLARPAGMQKIWKADVAMDFRRAAGGRDDK